MLNLLPGPVPLHPDVKQTYYQTFESHRTARFYNDVQEFSKELCEYTGAQNVAFLTGSGSLGNEVIASYLYKEKGKGLILCNGEFGKRLINQATQMGLDFISYNTNWKEF